MHPIRHRLLLPLGAAAAAASIAACGGSTHANRSAGRPGSSAHAPASAVTSTTPQRSAHIQIRNYMYMPMDVTVVPGAQVTFTNHDMTPHTATADGGGFDTGSIAPGHSVTVVLRRAGVYRYHCSFHAFMTARITVVKR